MSDETSAVAAALAHTTAAGTARITYELDVSWKLPEAPGAPPRGPLREASAKAGKTVGKSVGKALWRLATRKADPAHQRGEGFVELAGWRSMVDYGSFAQVQIGGEEWSGRSGRSRSTLPSRAARPSSPLWLIGLVAGVNGADDRGLVDVDGASWRHLSATASLADAAAAVGAPMASPQRDRYEELLALPLELWLDDTDLRRIRFATEHQTTAITLTDFGTIVDDLDWTRLPTFVTPD